MIEIYYTVELVHTEDDGKIYRQGFRVARTEHRSAALEIAKMPISKVLKMFNDHEQKEYGKQRQYSKDGRSKLSLAITETINSTKSRSEFVPLT